MGPSSQGWLSDACFLSIVDGCHSNPMVTMPRTRRSRLRARHESNRGLTESTFGYTKAGGHTKKAGAFLAKG